MKDDELLSQGTFSRTLNGPKYGRKKWSLVLDKVKVERIHGHYLPLEGTCQTSLLYSDDYELKVQNQIVRRDLDLSPDFRGTNAFTSKLPDEALLSKMDRDAETVISLWQMENTGTARQVTLDPRYGTERSWSFMGIMGLIIVTLLGLGLVIWKVVRKKPIL
jgi:hypothetical protein